MSRPVQQSQRLGLAPEQVIAKVVGTTYRRALRVPSVEALASWSASYDDCSWARAACARVYGNTENWSEMRYKSYPRLWEVRGPQRYGAVLVTEIYDCVMYVLGHCNTRPELKLTLIYETSC